jgi:hypothetical protein
MPDGGEGSAPVDKEVRLLSLTGALLVTFPVFLQAPWVRAAPLTAALFTAPLLALALLLERHGRGYGRSLGMLLVGFAASWLGGSLFWGWCRLHPLWHLPIEAFALPLALAGLGSRWRLACGFYLASLVGTAATDGAMAVSGLMPLWPEVLQAPLADAPWLLQEAALAVLRPFPLAVVTLAAAALIGICLWLWQRDTAARVGAAVLGTTVAVDALFLLAALGVPRLSGLI